MKGFNQVKLSFILKNLQKVSLFLSSSVSPYYFHPLLFFSSLHVSLFLFSLSCLIILFNTHPTLTSTPTQNNTPVSQDEKHVNFLGSTYFLSPMNAKAMKKKFQKLNDWPWKACLHLDRVGQKFDVEVLVCCSFFSHYLYHLHLLRSNGLSNCYSRKTSSLPPNSTLYSFLLCCCRWKCFRSRESSHKGPCWKLVETDSVQTRFAMEWHLKSLIQAIRWTEVYLVIHHKRFKAFNRESYLVLLSSSNPSNSQLSLSSFNPESADLWRKVSLYGCLPGCQYSSILQARVKMPSQSSNDHLSPSSLPCPSSRRSRCLHLRNRSRTHSSSWSRNPWKRGWTSRENFLWIQQHSQEG